MELVIQGIGGGIVGVALIRIPLLLLALWRQAGYKKRQDRHFLEVFRRRVRAAKAPHLEHERAESIVEETPSGIEVVFARSGRTCVWDRSVNSLLELAEENSIYVAYDCGTGSCGMCRTPIKSGAVKYATGSGAKPIDGSCLLCVSIPTGNLTLDA